MKGMEYLVGVRFEASGNLYASMGKMSAAMLAADEGASLLKNKFLDMASAGIGMFAALTDASVQYTNTLTKLYTTLNGVKEQHRDMGFALGGKGQSKYLSIGSSVEIAGGLNALYGGTPPKGALSNASSIADVLKYGGFTKNSGAAAVSLLTSGYRYGQALGETNSNQLQKTSIAAAKAAIGYADVAGPNKGAYYSDINRVLKSPLMSAFGKNVNLNTIAKWTAMGVETGNPNVVLDTAKLLSGKGLTNSRMIPLLMSKFFGFKVGTNNNVLAASMGNYVKMAASGSKDPMKSIAYHTFFGLEKMLGFTKNKFIPLNKLSHSQYKNILLSSYLDFGSNSPFYSILKTYLLDNKATNAKNNYNILKNEGNKRTDRKLGLITNSVSRIWASVGSGVATGGVLNTTGNTLSGVASYLSKNPKAAKAVGGGLTAGLFSVMGAGTIKLMTRYLPKFMPTFARAFPLLGAAGEGLAAYGFFRGGYATGTLLRGIPIIKSIGNIIGGLFYNLGKAVPGLQKVFMGLADTLKGLGTGSLKTVNRGFIDIYKSLYKIYNNIMVKFNNIFGSSSSSNKKSLHNNFSGVGDINFGNGYSTPQSWNAHKFFYNKQKDIEKYHLDYEDPHTNKNISQVVTIHFHGVNPNSKEGVRETTEAIVKALKNAVHGEGLKTAAPLAYGR